MQASDAARVFHDWAVTEGLLPDGPVAPVVSTEQEFAKIQPVSDAGKQLLRSKQLRAVAFSGGRQEIIVFTKLSAPTRAKQLAAIPNKVDDVQITYRQGVQNPIGGELSDRPPPSDPVGMLV